LRTIHGPRCRARKKLTITWDNGRNETMTPPVQKELQEEKKARKTAHSCSKRGE